MVWCGPVADPLDDERERCKAWFNEGLTDEDREWIRRQWALISIEPPNVDISWLETEKVRW